jgi:oligopeptide transport system substrate-binding protein
MMKLGQTLYLDFDYARARLAYDEGFALWQRAVTRRPSPDLPVAPHALRLAWAEPLTLDPTMGGTNMYAPLLTQLLSGLVGQSPAMDVVPDVAYRWEVLDEGRRYVFYLRDDVVWSDGVPVTAADFEFTFKRALDPATQAPVAGMLLDPVRGARAFSSGETDDRDSVAIYAVDEHTLVIELEEPTSYFLDCISYYVLLPVPRHIAEQEGDAWATSEAFVGNGPFHITSWQHGEKLVLERNPTWHGPRAGNVERVELTLDLTKEQHLALYDAGELDLTYNWFLPVESLVELIHRHRDDYDASPFFGTVYCFFDITQPPLDDIRVRRALAMTVDQEALSRLTTGGYEWPATGGLVPRGMPGFAPGAALPFNPEEARRLLAEAGYGAGERSLTLTLLCYSTRRSAGEYLQAQWQKHLGLDVTLTVNDVVTMADIRQSRPMVPVGGWIADYNDPDNFLRINVDLDVPTWRNEEYVRLLEEARRTTDQTARMRVYEQADRVLMEEAVIVPLTYAKRHLFLKPWVRHLALPAIKHPGFWKDVVLMPH